MKRYGKILSAIAALGLALALAVVGLKFLDPGGESLTPARILIHDREGLFDDTTRHWIRHYHDHLLKAHDIDYRILIVSHASDINMLAAKQFTEMEVGSLSKTGRGFLLVLDPAANQARLEV
ncbi:hypothetical protein Thimo_2274 [Thioflavicoccus mobilis 8321]|uniref:TPM domain-containing protein n=1 Tax=Thioflavicoccus mobilis 8321 TaxID=765912 RepID=L0H0B5_9GAMM|nr:TPM domain-containing protein [Thioflavicoccus mobilis]AGA91019.1 hypothetical protein Thimo_2274 [Thioflavicoccus mobilis 8321]